MVGVRPLKGGFVSNHNGVLFDVFALFAHYALTILDSTKWYLYS